MTDPVVPGPVPIVPDAKTELSLTDPSSEQVIQRQSTSQDYTVLRYAVIGLMLAMTISLVGVILLSWKGIPTPDGIVAIGSAAVGALATMLIPGRLSRGTNH